MEQAATEMTAAGTAMTAATAELVGKRVRLEPLEPRHHDGLCEAVRDGSLWELAVTMVPHPDDVRGFIEDAVAAREEGTQIPYATVDAATGRVLGSTRLMVINTANRRLEIGWTFLAESSQRSGANTEAKLLMLTHAFEAMGMNRVELLTDVRNAKSRAAILRLGATHEGVLRHHMVMRDGWIRDTAVYSITRPEWPEAKRGLETRLSRSADGSADRLTNGSADRSAG
ncbi:GNAT family N-acetyltransferase [Streptomyces sp. ISL-43]|uniref:GNAT family N-acetyltransferase n=1 Tax=Streptomyces sp. ISL-43 TaxID=2819183 RepID=UPI001BE7AAC8|nr:GNAT family protein [Streptomyces sp. ISL-43]MBT2452247.1 GNAT family N-acetyltransferase [Streptomyces sp. ISL-43]